MTIHIIALFGAKPRAPKRYKGGFEETMTRREAALILGVRESADIVKCVCDSGTECKGHASRGLYLSLVGL